MFKSNSVQNVVMIIATLSMIVLVVYLTCEPIDKIKVRHERHERNEQKIGLKNAKKLRKQKRNEYEYARSLVALHIKFKDITADWIMFDNPKGAGIVVVNDKYKVWLVLLNENLIYTVNGSAKAITPNIPYTHSLCYGDVAKLIYGDFSRLIKER